MRGLVAAHIMATIEERTGLAMADMVDVFMGPSTGAIINSGLNVPHPHYPDRPRFKARHMVRFYERQGIKIFTTDKYRKFRSFIHDFNNRTMRLSQLNWLMKHGHYDPTNLHRALRNMYGKLSLQDTLCSLVIPTYNIDGQQMNLAKERDDTDETPVRTTNNMVDGGGHAVWLKNLKFPHIRKSQAAPSVSLVDAVMASTAAPTFFPCHHFQVKPDNDSSMISYSGIDGSIFDNPCISYLGALRPHIKDDTEVIMIILGTGYTHRSFKHEDWNRFGSLGVVDPVNDFPLINIFFHASESALMDAFAKEVGDHLYVFNRTMLASDDPMSTPNEQIDDASPDNLEKLHNFANLIMDENKSRLDDLCQLLSSNYDDKRNPKTGKKNKSKRSLFSFLRE